jgi:hypothetical protein
MPHPQRGHARQRIEGHEQETVVIQEERYQTTSIDQHVRRHLGERERQTKPDVEQAASWAVRARAELALARYDADTAKERTQDGSKREAEHVRGFVRDATAARRKAADDLAAALRRLSLGQTYGDAPAAPSAPSAQAEQGGLPWDGVEDVPW